MPIFFTRRLECCVKQTIKVFKKLPANPLLTHLLAKLPRKTALEYKILTKTEYIGLKFNLGGLRRSVTVHTQHNIHVHTVDLCK